MKKRLFEDISEFVFLEDDLEEVDIIFILGGSYAELAEEGSKLWKMGLAPLILPSGGVSCKLDSFGGPKSKKEIYNSTYDTEFDFLKDVLLRNGVSEESILKENKSSFTKENAYYSRLVTLENKLTIKKAIICCKAFHSRRCLMSYQFEFPHTKFYIHPVTISKDHAVVSKETWMQSKVGIDLVLGEIQRYSTQFKKEFYSQIDS